MHKVTLAAIALMTSVSFASAQEETVPPAPLEPVPMQDGTSGQVIVEDAQPIQQGTIVNEGTVVQQGTIVEDGAIQQGQIIHDGSTIQQGQPIYTQQAQATTYRQPVRRVSSRRSSGFFGRMMELERRKNAWLRRTFLNR